jgi:hypothetical protein
MFFMIFGLTRGKGWMIFVRFIGRGTHQGDILFPHRLSHPYLRWKFHRNMNMIMLALVVFFFFL